MTETTGSPVNTRAITSIGVVTEVFTAILDRVSSWRDDIVRSTSARKPTTRELDELIESLVVPSLSTASTNISGAGFVAAPGYLPDSYWHLSWWLGELSSIGGKTGVEHPIRRLEAVTDPTSGQFRDYTNLEWWRIPERTGAPHITGPYVDYLCTDDYTLTVTMPVYSAPTHSAPTHSESALIGMAGVDSSVKHIESLLLPQLFAIGCAATVVNASARVVASSDPHRASGSILRIAGLSEQLHAWTSFPKTGAGYAPLPGGETVLECPGTGLAMVLDERVVAR